MENIPSVDYLGIVPNLAVDWTESKREGNKYALGNEMNDYDGDMTQSPIRELYSISHEILVLI